MENTDTPYTEPDEIGPVEVELADRTGAVGSALPDLPVVPAESEMRALAQLANTLAAAAAVPKSLRGKPNDVFLILLSARDLGVSLTAAMREFHVIEGKVTLSPKVKLAMVRSSGLGDLWPAASNSAESATWYARRHDHPEHVVESTFGWSDAQLAGLVDSRCTPAVHWSNPAKNLTCLCKDNWRRYPSRMVSWRSLGYLVDDVFAEIGTGLYSPDELGAVTDADGEPIAVTGVEALPGMRGGARPVIPEDEAPADVKADLAARIAGLPESARAEFVAWWKAEVGVKVDHLPARLVAKVEARLTWQEADENRGRGDSDGGSGRTGPEPVSDPETPVEQVIRLASDAPVPILSAAFEEATGRTFPSDVDDNDVRQAWSRWWLTEVGAGFLTALAGDRFDDGEAREAAEDALAEAI